MKKKTYIYNKEVINFFEKKLHSFHDSFVDIMLLSGLAEQGQDLEEIKFSKHPSYTLKYYQRIVGGFKNVKHSIQIQAFDDKGLNAELFFTNIHYDEHINNVFFIQNVMNWGGKEKFCCQVWQLKPTSIEKINNYWAS